MTPQLSLEQLAERTGESVARLREWQSLGLLGSSDGERFEHDDVERVRLVQLFLRRGIDLRTVAEGTKGGVFSRSISRYLEKFATQGPRSVYPLSEAANRVGLDVSTLRRFHEVLGEPGEYLDEQ